MTASAVGNMPEKEVDTIKEMVMRGVMHADENFFDFKVFYGFASIDLSRIACTPRCGDETLRIQSLIYRRVQCGA